MVEELANNLFAVMIKLLQGQVFVIHVQLDLEFQPIVEDVNSYQLVQLVKEEI